ncbi:MAG: hypothetical protein QW474_02985 [Candidatus Aenigmatarchaeota archaeon]
MEKLNIPDYFKSSDNSKILLKLKDYQFKKDDFSALQLQSLLEMKNNIEFLSKKYPKVEYFQNLLKFCNEIEQEVDELYNKILAKSDCSLNVLQFDSITIKELAKRARFYKNTIFKINDIYMTGIEVLRYLQDKSEFILFKKVSEKRSIKKREEDNSDDEKEDLMI